MNPARNYLLQMGVIPMLGLVMALLLLSLMADQWSELRANGPYTDPAALCTANEEALPGLCLARETTWWLLITSTLLLLLTSALVLLLRRYPERLPAQFWRTPSLWYRRLLHVNTVLVVLRSLVLLLLITAPALFWMGRAPVATLALVGIALMYFIPGVHASGKRIQTMGERELLGLPAPEPLHALLKERLERCAPGPEALTPERVLLGNRPGLWLWHERARNLHDGQLLQGRTLYIAASFPRLLNSDEFDALLGHALSQSRDARSEQLSAVRHWLELRGQAQQQAKRLRSRGDLGPAAETPLTMSSLFLDAFASAGKLETWCPEDSAAAFRLTSQQHDPVVLASALLKAEICAEVWSRKFRPELNLRMSVAKDPRNLVTAFPTTVRELETPQRHLNRALEQNDWLREELDAGQLEAASTAALRFADSNWLEYADREAFEIRLSDEEKDWMIRTGRASTPTDSWENRGEARLNTPRTEVAQ